MEGLIWYIREGIRHLSASKGLSGFSSSTTAMEVAEKNTDHIKGRTFFMTGVSSGVGYEAARALLSQGGHVIMACRPGQKADQAFEKLKAEYPNAKVELMGLDLEDIDSVERFPEQFKAAGHKKIDVLINNAGIMQVPYHLTKCGWERHWAVNHLSHFALTNGLLPFLQAAEGDVRVVNLASEAHRKIWGETIKLDDLTMANFKGSDFLRRTFLYGNSKRANLMHAAELHDRLQEKPQTRHITAYSLHPGVILTSLWAPAAAPIKTVLKLGSLFLKDEQQGAATTVYCAVDPSARVLRTDPGYFADCNPCETSKECMQKERRQELWRVSAQMIKERKLQQDDAPTKEDAPAASEGPVSAPRQRK